MMEHPLIRPTFRVNRPSYSPTAGLWQKAGFLGKFLLSGQGPIATITEAQAFLRTSSDGAGAGRADALLARRCRLFG